MFYKSKARSLTLASVYACRKGSLSWIPLAVLVSRNIMQRVARTQFSLVNPHTTQSQGIPTDSLATDTAFGEND